jgi:hypothetical protein
VPATALTARTITETGYTPVAEVAGDNTNGNSVDNTSGRVWLEFTNGGGSTATVTVTFPYLVHGQTIPAKSYSIAAAAKLRVGPFDPSVYGQTLTFTPSAATVTVAAYQLAV